MRPDPTIVTFSGGMVSLLNPKTSQINLIDIAHHLALTNRFNGATRQPYSVAQHSCLVTQLLRLAGHGPRVQLYGHLHDAKEFVIGDQTTPLKVALFGSTGLPTDLDELEDGIDLSIYHRMGMREPTQRELELVAQADKLALATEWRDLMPRSQACPVSIEPAPMTVHPWPWQLAEKRFHDTTIRLAVEADVAVPSIDELAETQTT